jgi:hypothetical protein
MRRRAHGIGARRLAPAFEIFEKGGEPFERFELVRVDREEMPGHVVEPIVAREQDERRRVGGLDDDVGHHHFELFDPARRSGLFRFDRHLRKPGC